MEFTLLNLCTRLLTLGVSNLLWSLLYGVSKSHLESTISCGFFQKIKFLLEIILERGWKLRMAPVFSVVRRHLFSEYGVATQLWFVLSHIFKFQLGCSLLSIGQCIGLVTRKMPEAVSCLACAEANRTKRALGRTATVLACSGQPHRPLPPPRTSPMMCGDSRWRGERARSS